MLALTCKLAGERLAFDASQIVEVIPTVALRALPKAPEGIAGLLSFRGQVVPVVDLARAATGVDCARRLSTRIILLRVPSDRLLGVMAEDATETVSIADNALVEAGVQTDAPWAGAVAVTTDEGAAVQLVKPEALLPEDLRVRLEMDMERQVS